MINRCRPPAEGDSRRELAGGIPAPCVVAATPSTGCWSAVSPCCRPRADSGRRRSWRTSPGTRKERGLVVGWISLDDDDTPNVFGSYLAGAFEPAGLDLSLLSTQDAWASSPAVQQMGMLARAVELHEAACLLVLDEVDRLPRRTVQLIDLLLKRAPRNLHVAMAFRADPELDLALPILDEGAVVVGAEDLRFSRFRPRRCGRPRSARARGRAGGAGGRAAIRGWQALRGAPASGYLNRAGGPASRVARSGRV